VKGAHNFKTSLHLTAKKLLKFVTSAWSYSAPNLAQCCGTHCICDHCRLQNSRWFAFV